MMVARVAVGGLAGCIVEMHAPDVELPQTAGTSNETIQVSCSATLEAQQIVLVLIDRSRVTDYKATILTRR